MFLLACDMCVCGQLERDELRNYSHSTVTAWRFTIDSTAFFKFLNWTVFGIGIWGISVCESGTCISSSVWTYMKLSASSEWVRHFRSLNGRYIPFLLHFHWFFHLVSCSQRLRDPFQVPVVVSQVKLLLSNSAFISAGRCHYFCLLSKITDSVTYSMFSYVVSSIGTTNN